MPTKAPADSAQMQRKTAVIDDIKARLDSSDAAVLTEYRGLTVSDIAALRAALRPAATDYKIFKNTLARRAARDSGLEDLVESLEGPVAIAFVRRDGGDAVTAAKALRDFARTNPNLVLKGGILGQRLLSGREIESLAEIPPREQLLAQIAGLLEAPLANVASLLNAALSQAAYGVQALIDKRIAEGEQLPDDTAAPAASTESEPAAAAEPEPAAEPEVEAAAEAEAEAGSDAPAESAAPSEIAE
jgi:large subunit ribosomal protein L10